jgi:hypothetical protein
MNVPEELREEAAHALKVSPIPALRKLGVEEVAGGIILVGRVPSYYCKQMAQETVMPLLRGRLLQNQVEVVSASR